MVADSTEDAIIDTVEELYDDLGDIEEVMDYMRKALETAERSLRLKYGDY
jgi:tetrahydromethanopterin S-methyltransferase subunit B